MTREEAISHIEYSIKAYQNLIENDARSGEAIGKDIKGEWKSEKTLADAYMKMIESLTMAIKALEQEQYYKDLAESYEKTINKLTKAIAEQEPKTDSDCISRQAVLDLMEYYNLYSANLMKCLVSDMPSVNAEPKTEWIPVSEKLPEIRLNSYGNVIAEYVLIWRERDLDSAEYDIGFFNGCCFEKYEGGGIVTICHMREVKAWQPLPEPYKVESEVSG